MERVSFLVRPQEDQEMHSPNCFATEPFLAIWAKASALLYFTAAWWELGHTQTPGLVCRTIRVGSQTVSTRCVTI